MIATRHPVHALLIALIAALTFRQGLAVSAADSLCPETVSVKQTGVPPSSEWSLSYSTTPIQLERVTFYSGPPKDEASLVYDAWVNAEDSSTATWKLPKDPRGYWIKCSYRGTTLELSKTLSPTVSSCRVTYDRQTSSSAGLPVIKRIACQ